MRAPGNPWQGSVRDLRRGLVFALLLSLALNLLMLAVPIYSMQLFDRVLGSGRVETLILLTLALAMALMAFGALEAIRASLLARLATRFERRLARQAVAAAAGQGQAGAAALRDLATIRAAITGPAMTATFDAPWLPLALAALWLLHPMLAGFTAASAVVLGILAVLNDLATRKAQHRANLAQLEAQALTDAIARKAEAVRALGMLEALTVRTGRLHDTSLAGQQAAAERGGLAMGVTRALRLAVQAGIMGIAAWLALRSEIGAGAMLAASILASKALAPVEQMLGAWRTVTPARDAWRRLAGLLGRPDAGAATRLPMPTGRVELESAAVRTADGRVLLREVSLALEPGTCLAVVGPSGAGKSTLCRLLAGVASPAIGAIRLDGATLDQYGPDELGRHLGYLPQDTMLFAGTVAENIARMAPEIDDMAVVAAARLAGAHELILRLTEGYQTRLGDGGAPLSGGQRQRLGLARALYGTPKLVILDEPNANLDTAGEAALMATLGELKAAGTTVVMATHRPQVLQRADLVLVLEGGRVADLGPRDAILAKLTRPVRAA